MTCGTGTEGRPPRCGDTQSDEAGWSVIHSRGHGDREIVRSMAPGTLLALGTPGGSRTVPSIAAVTATRRVSGEFGDAPVPGDPNGPLIGELHP